MREALTLALSTGGRGNSAQNQKIEQFFMKVNRLEARCFFEWLVQKINIILLPAFPKS